jgi:Protein of unknown function (DUF3800)
LGEGVTKGVSKSASIMPILYHGFMDESGDRGTRTTAQNHFLFGGYVIDKNDEPQIAAALAGIRQQYGLPPGHHLHFSNLSHHRRLRLAHVVSGLPIAAFAAVLCKRAGGAKGPIHADQLYNWMARLVMERCSWYLRDEVQSIGSLMFAHTKGCKTKKMHRYVQILKGQQTQIDWAWLHTPIRFSNTQTDERLQVADAIASAVGYAFEPQHGFTEERYLRTLAPILLRRYGQLASYGLKIQPAFMSRQPCGTSHAWTAAL